MEREDDGDHKAGPLEVMVFPNSPAENSNRGLLNKPAAEKQQGLGPDHRPFERLP